MVSYVGNTHRRSDVCVLRLNRSGIRTRPLAGALSCHNLHTVRIKNTIHLLIYSEKNASVCRAARRPLLSCARKVKYEILTLVSYSTDDHGAADTVIREKVKH